MKIGIGVITMGVRTINKKLFENSEHGIFIYTDKERLGPSHARNKVLEHFDDYDHIFIFDDDCYPTKLGWEQYFITKASEYGIHYMAIPEVFGGEFISSDNEMQYWYSALGCFVYQDKVAMATIGGYNTAYNRYGYEDAARSRRALHAGLTGHDNAWGFPVRGLSYIHSEDVFGENPVPNIDTPEKLKYIESNHKIYAEEISSPTLFYPYK
jgi:hypothetical protein|nr:MAG TPA: glycosyltransferase [Caudoviricetes sp.]